MKLPAGTPKTMKDGTTGYITNSNRYYARQEPYPDFKKIVYYTLEGEHIPLAKAKCSECEQVLESKMCGDYQGCKCGKSYVDTDRWSPEQHRFGGKAKELQ